MKLRKRDGKEIEASEGRDGTKRAPDSDRTWLPACQTHARRLCLLGLPVTASPGKQAAFVNHHDGESDEVEEVD